MMNPASCRCQARPAPGSRCRVSVLAATALLALAGCAAEDAVRPAPTPVLPAPPGSLSHHLMVALEREQLANPAALDTLMRGFDTFLYGHQGAYEDEVARLEATGRVSFRYFNIFSTDPLYPTWPGFYAELDAFLAANDGWIDGVGYAFYSNREDPDRIINHTRSEVSSGVARIVSRWGDAIGADHIFLDLTFDTLSDWMLRAGDRWPWPPEHHSYYAQRWAANMQSLIEQVDLSRPVMINGSVRLQARAVLYENQVWNHRRGFSPWGDLIARVQRGETVPALHLGHDHLQPWEHRAAESMVLAAWLLTDESYLLVEPEGRPLAWAREIQAAGFAGFVPDEPVAEVAPGVYRRTGWIGDRRWRVEVDVPRERGSLIPVLDP